MKGGQERQDCGKMKKGRKIHEGMKGGRKEDAGIYGRKEYTGRKEYIEGRNIFREGIY